MLGFGNRKQNPEEREYLEAARGGYPVQPQGYPEQAQPGAAPMQGMAPGMMPGAAPAQYGMPMPAQGMRGAADPRLEAYIAKRTAEIDAQVREFSKKNPDFDIRRELQDPKFCNYLWGNGLSVEDAYYLAHRGEEQAENNRVKPEEPEKRISENGTSKPGGSGMVKKNPEDMSDEEVDDIIRRVRRGEKISF